MQRIKIHEWRDWLLVNIGEGKYELSEKNTSSASTIAIVAKNAMDAENQCQQIIKQGKTIQIPDPQNLTDS